MVFLVTFASFPITRNYTCSKSKGGLTTNNMLGKTQSDARPKILVLTQFIPACRILLLFVEEDYLKLEFNSVSSK